METILGIINGKKYRLLIDKFPLPEPKGINCGVYQGRESSNTEIRKKHSQGGNELTVKPMDSTGCPAEVRKFVFIYIVSSNLVNRSVLNHFFQVE